jgi:succinate dehydrogenase / fumarate reductase cytochrome b subunit
MAIDEKADRREGAHMNETTAALSFYSTSLGKKVVMSVTGVILLLFVIGHLIGNLQVYAGPAKLNAYAVLLRSVPALLWSVRGVLLVTLLLHIYTGLTLWLQNRRSRPVRYEAVTPTQSTVSSRNMMLAGAAILFFVVYHLLHLTLGKVHGPFDEHDVFANVVRGFSQWQISAAYVLAMIFLGLHLYHGTWSMFQSIGLTTMRHGIWRRRLASALVIALVVGNISMPVAILITNWPR